MKPVRPVKRSARDSEIADAPVRPRGRLLVFVHIPKTAGSTLRTVLSMNEPGARSRALGNVFKGGGGISTGLVERLRNDQGPNLRGVGLVRGHFPLGIREYLPKYIPKSRELRCFTFLREPADRTLSHYFRIRESPAPYGLPPLPAEATVQDALERGYIHDNVQTRMLSGLPEPFGEVTDEMLEQAKHNLREELVFFGLTERFDESLVLAKRRLGFRSILYRSTGRVNTTRPRGDEVPAELIRAAEACNRYDIELYRYAEQLFDSAPERKELEFEIELAALRAAKADGEIDLDVPPPAGFDADEQVWRMLLHARAASQHLEWELGESGIKAAAARSKSRDLKQEMERREAVPSRMKELEQEVERLKAAAGSGSRRDARHRNPEDARARPKRDARQGAPKRARARPKRDARQGAPKRARARPKRNAKRGSSKRSDEPRARPRGSGGRAGPDQGAGSDGG